MQIVIKISEEDYKLIKSYGKGSTNYRISLNLYEAVKNGTPLPKGHGELKDADAMIKKLCTHEASELFGSVTCAEIMDFISDEKPIIEADKRSESE